MLCLSVFAPVLCNAGGVGLGALHVVGLTVGSAVLGSLTYIVYRRNWQAPSPCKVAVDVRMHSCCGASDVAAAFATVATCLRPIRRFAVGRFFLPSWMCFLTGSMIFWDLTSLGSDDGVGHESHLAGTAFGLAYYLVAFRKRYGVW